MSDLRFGAFHITAGPPGFTSLVTSGALPVPWASNRAGVMEPRYLAREIVMPRSLQPQQRFPKRVLGLGALVILVSVPLPASERRLEPGAESLAAPALEPFTARFRETMSLPDGTSRSQKRIVHLQEAHFPSGEGLRYLTTLLGEGWTVSDEIQVERQTLRPVLRWVSALTLTHRLEIFTNDRVRSVRMSKDGAEVERSELPLEGPRFEAASLDLVLARVAKQEGLVLEVPVYSSDMGPMAHLTARARVVGQEPLELAGRTFSTYKVEIRMVDGAGEPLQGPGGAPFPVIAKWISARPPYVVRADFGPGHRVELEEVER